ncbi:hypothetical protein IC757_05870 [Wenzhouxiangella sp. AB-CW3]|uniref:hypothetical protein n=1 Tax=Wenzhouxiangella sp. AB-CW3 TaxID=2771012 RepID=UPI00168A4CE6|nr:hypothetical protein [Wenzhouxiangella sp. AB-CW3]QOC23666.1 hypothetical protein IC757_05870 [Wenzhouxiangella sp. AB-CW3]
MRKTVLVVMATAGLLGASGNAFGQHLWIGNESEDWFDSDNWDGGVPNSGTSQVRINTTNPNPTLIDGNAAETGNSFSVGHNASGELSIVNGGSLHTHGSGVVGSQAGGDGSVIIRGAGSSWEVDSSNSAIGNSGAGELEILDGGQWIGPGSGTISIGWQASGSGSVVVSGTGSSMDFGGGNFWLGHVGSGQMTISDGGQVLFGTTSTVAQAANSHGEVLLTGAGSLLSGTRLHVGNSSSGHLRLVDGAMLHLTGSGSPANYRLVIGANPGSEGEVVVGGPAGESPEAPGQMDLFGGVLFNGGAGTLVFNHTGSLDMPFPIEGPVGTNASGLIRAENGATLFSGQPVNYSGSLLIEEAGVFGASGQLGDVTNEGTLVASPGQSAALSIGGDYVHGENAVLAIELAPGPVVDLVEVSGAVTIEGGSVAFTVLPGNYGREPLDGLYPILTAAEGIVGEFDQIVTSNPNAYVLVHDGDTVYVQVNDRMFHDRYEQ